MSQRNKNGKETATVGKPKYTYAGYNIPFAKPNLVVEMTPAQQHRQDLQIAWLQAAVDAQDQHIPFDLRKEISDDIKALERSKEE